MSLEREKKRKKFSYSLIVAMIVGTVVGSGIVKDSVKWATFGGFWALLGVFIVWLAFLICGYLMYDNVSMMPEKGGVYAWARETMGRFWGIQVGWIYLIGYTCLSVILSYLAYVYTLDALNDFFTNINAFFLAEFFSILIPMGFVAAFQFTYGLGIKPASQIIVGFFIIRGRNPPLQPKYCL